MLDPSTGCSLRDVSNGNLLVAGDPSRLDIGFATAWAGTDAAMADSPWNVAWSCTAAVGGALTCTMDDRIIQVQYFGQEQIDGVRESLRHV